MTSNVMMIDPWGINNLSMYTNGLCQGLAERTKLTLCTNWHYQKTTDASYEIKKLFFKRSEKMEQGLPRRFVRFWEYLIAYRRIIKELKSGKYDIVHIQWLLNYKTDLYFLKRIKKYCPKVVYTAHNVIPHRADKKHIGELGRIYSITDRIVLHGEGIRREFASLFGEYKDKVRIQLHGTYLNQKVQYDPAEIDKEILEEVKSYDKVYLVMGNVFYNKGVDRLVRIWLENFKDKEDQLLVIAGRKNRGYPELEELDKDIRDCPNLLYINRFIEEDLLNFLIDSCRIILMPYRHASMSGVVFTAAEFAKTILCTDTGALAEYLLNEENCFLVENDERAFRDKLKYISAEVTEQRLQQMGLSLRQHIHTEFSWDRISEKLVAEVYLG